MKNVFLESAIQKLQWCSERSDSMSVDISPKEAEALLSFIQEGSRDRVVSVVGPHADDAEGAGPESLLESKDAAYVAIASLMAGHDPNDCEDCQGGLPLKP